jgi:hypothetical protein
MPQLRTAELWFYQFQKAFPIRRDPNTEIKINQSLRQNPTIFSIEPCSHTVRGKYNHKGKLFLIHQ